MKRRVQKQRYRHYLDDLIFDVSLDPNWRRKLFSAKVGERFPVTGEGLDRVSPELKRAIKTYNLKFTVFNDGWTEDGDVVFGFSCEEFPYIDVYSFNNPNVI